MLPDNIEIRQYPTDFMMRYDSFASDYCDMALEAYHDALTLYETMVAAEWRLGSIDFQMPKRMKKKTMTAIVFTAMCAESFINDYLSIRLGDKQFAQYCDGESYFVKLEMIMSDLLRQRDYQSLEWSKGITELFRKRNKLVHNVSHAMTAAHFVKTRKYDDWRSEAEANLKLKKVQEEFPLDEEEQLYAFLRCENPEDIVESSNPTVADTTQRHYF